MQLGLDAKPSAIHATRSRRLISRKSHHPTKQIARALGFVGG